MKKEKKEKRDYVMYFRLTQKDAESLRNVATCENRTISNTVSNVVKQYLSKKQPVTQQDNPA